MSAALPLVAMILGYGLLLCAGIACVGIATIYVIAYFPARLDVRRGGKLVGRLVYSDRGDGHNMTFLAGVSARGKIRWFFGLMLFDPDATAPPRWPVLLSEKRRNAPAAPDAPQASTDELTQARSREAGEVPQ